MKTIDPVNLHNALRDAGLVRAEHDCAWGVVGSPYAAALGSICEDPSLYYSEDVTLPAHLLLEEANRQLAAERKRCETAEAATEALQSRFNKLADRLADFEAEALSVKYDKGAGVLTDAVPQEEPS